MTRIVVHDRIDDRIVVQNRGTGFVDLVREYRTANGWQVDHDAGLSFGLEYVEEIVSALRAMLQSSEGSR